VLTSETSGTSADAEALDAVPTDSEQFGNLLVDCGLLTATALRLALDEHDISGQSLSRVLIDNSLVTETDLVSVLARQLGIRFVDLSDYPVDPTAVTMVSEPLARRYVAVPIGWDNGRLLLAMADPSNVVAIDDIRVLTGREIEPMIATEQSIGAAIDRYHRVAGDADAIAAQASQHYSADTEATATHEVVEDGPIVRLIDLLISRAVADGASDIHIEPNETDVRVRYRIDGVLHEVMRSPKNTRAGMISRLKVMADINIAERRIPQDGRITANVAGRDVDLRVATLPTVHGEKVVMRILDKSTALLKLSDLGFLADNMARYERSFTKSHGTILVTGPTGSGKSTTLYATLNLLNDEGMNIITVEDPVEYLLPNVNQIQVNNKTGLSFAKALRAILRADPDIILVGEIRDTETANIAIQAALTGHLVLSSLHTNDAVTTPSRLVEMGVEPFLVGSAIDCIVAQRLARRLCDRCKEAYTPTRAEMLSLGSDGQREELEHATIYRPVGCEACGRTGYRGRFAIHEVLPVTEEIGRLISDRAQSGDIKTMAIAQGMQTLREAGHSQVIAGLTSVREILRVAG
jgi:type IV pilus assembly protein PilB